MKKKFYKHKIKSLQIIAPEKKLLKIVRDTIDIIKITDKKEYKKLFSRIDTIFITNRTGYTNEFFMPERIWFTNQSVITQNDLPWLASLIVHEAFHATQFKNGKWILPLGKQIEEPALEAQSKFLKKLQKAEDINRDFSKIQKSKHWQKMNSDKNSFVYFRNLLNLMNK